jgi:hypothetical protein
MTGEKLPPAASNRHILGQEALRCLALWDYLDNDSARNGVRALNFILDIDQKRTGESMIPARISGKFCCTKCTLALLRTVSVIKSENWENTLESGIQNITSTRDGKGRWRRFPYYYTLLTLTDCATPSAYDEMKYTSFHARKLINRYQDQSDLTSQFRRYILSCVLSESQSP